MSHKDLVRIREDGCRLGSGGPQVALSPPRQSNPRQRNPYASPNRNEITELGLQVLEARDGLTGYARVRYDSAATNAQQGLVQFSQKLQEDDLHTRTPDSVKNSGWNRKFKSHDKVNKRVMTGAEAAEKDADKRERKQWIESLVCKLRRHFLSLLTQNLYAPVLYQSWGSQLLSCLLLPLLLLPSSIGLLRGPNV